MINDLEIGQILWLKVRYQLDIVSDVKHPMLVAYIDSSYIEIIAIDKAAGKLHNLFLPYNEYINSENPHESVIYEDSYAQLNTKLTIDNFMDLIQYRKTKRKLSKIKLDKLLCEYNNYQNQNIISEERIIHMSKDELISINS